MTNEELLIPRFKVLMDYPTNRFNISEIITMDYAKVPERDFINAQKGEEHDKMSRALAEFRKYPEIFSELRWYFFRKESDMPQYVKYVKNTGEIDDVRKVAKWLHFENAPDQIRGFIDKECNVQISLDGYVPATKEELVEFNKKIK